MRTERVHVWIPIVVIAAVPDAEWARNCVSRVVPGVVARAARELVRLADPGWASGLRMAPEWLACGSYGSRVARVARVAGASGTAIHWLQRYLGKGCATVATVASLD
jgi:hypothetical protein